MLDTGVFKMRTEILELIAGIALSRIEGATGTGMRADHPDDLKKRKSLTKGIRVEEDEGSVVFDLDVSMEYGKDFVALAMEIQGAVAEKISTMTGWGVEAVNVNVVGVNAS
ncbi:MAG: Asp23/Gls24 family envelope stress response protein [Actinobacteria bacterium]|jgi:uncharacterized alkaline shock family protein YloU|nr:MAG: Asp23/Gls24 family envelope stress response protein [Actinomycetota bacterium]